MNTYIDRTAVGMRIHEIRQSAGLTLEEFGERILGTGKSTVSKWEKGIVLPNSKRLKAISMFSGKSVDWLLYGGLFEFIAFNIFEFTDEADHYIISHTDLSMIKELANRLEADGVSPSHLEKVRIELRNALPDFKNTLESQLDKQLNFLSQHREKWEDVYAAIKSEETIFTSTDIDHVHTIFFNAAYLNLKEKIFFEDLIEACCIYLNDLYDEYIPPEFDGDVDSYEHFKQAVELDALSHPIHTIDIQQHLLYAINAIQQGQDVILFNGMSTEHMERNLMLSLLENTLRTMDDFMRSKRDDPERS